MKLTCESLAYSYPGSSSPVLEDFNLSIGGGATLMKGYSGCGKSTLLRLLGGLLKPSGGKIRAPGFPPLGSQKFLRESFSMVFQELNLLPLASVWRNLELSCQIAGVDRRNARVWLERLGMDGYADRRVDTLSGGQKQRVAIARAMAKSPGMLLLDEPTSGLDDENTGIILSAISDYSKERDSICVIASHDHRMDPIAHELVDFHRFLSLAK